MARDRSFYFLGGRGEGGVGHRTACFFFCIFMCGCLRDVENLPFSLFSSSYGGGVEDPRFPLVPRAF